jgi:hypothetical protein
MQSFTLADLPNLDEVVYGALEFLDTETLVKIDLNAHIRPLVIGSGNALPTGQIMFRDADALFVDEGNYETALARVPVIDAFYLISASGGKHAVHIAERLSDMNRPLYLITTNKDAKARAYVSGERVFVYPRIREPYTYNTSTYLGMILSTTHESPSAIHSFITATIMPEIPKDFGKYDSYIFIVPPEFSVLKAMFETKFDELFGPRLHARVFTSEEIKHAKTVVYSDAQCFVSLGTQNKEFGDAIHRIEVPLPPSCGPAAFLAIGYVLIGNIQNAKHPYFKENIVAYTKQASDLFGETINPIVE